jgi:hypothetical protein
MSSPESLLSYYPTYNLLDSIILQKNCKNLNLFIDLKNTLQTTYMEHAILNIITNSKKSRFKDTSVFSAVLAFLSFHKIYAIKRNIGINFYIFFESGRSYYHQNISKKYKISRRIDDLYGLDKQDQDIFREVLQDNFYLLEQAANKIPKIKVINVLNLEADFIPYYLISRKFIPENEVNIVYSNDHDLYQCINENTFQFSKSATKKFVIKKDEVMKTYLKRDCDISDEYLPLAMSVIGDTGDDVDGIYGIGGKRFIDVFPELKKSVKSMENLYENVQNSKPIFDLESTEGWNKYMILIAQKETDEKFISNNLKLVSFELISRALDDPTDTEMIKRKEKIQKLFTNDKLSDCKDLKNALERSGVFLEDWLENLFFEVKIGDSTSA